LLDAGIEFAKLGGTIDFTASTTDKFIEEGEYRASAALARALNLGVPPGRLTISSDAQGSLPHFDENGNFDGLEVGQISSLLDEFQRAVFDEGVDLATALRAFTANPAAIMGLANKGRIHPGADADLNLLHPGTLALQSVMAKGHWVLKDDKVLANTPFDR
jgi:beta-aspartyl-dipeptidase (metallo-type)